MNLLAVQSAKKFCLPHFPFLFSLSLSLSSLFLQYKDFMMMLVHHLATILLIIISYTNNMIRYGTLVMCLHDVSDIFLEVKVHLVFNLVSPGMAADAPVMQNEGVRLALCHLSHPSD